MRLLSYVHLRNIYKSTGAGTVARELTEQLALQPGVDLQILADRKDHGRILPLIGAPWSSFAYNFLPHETSVQQAIWIFADRPSAESFWPEAEIVFCTGESYVPTRKARLAVTMHDVAYFEPHAHRKDAAYWAQRLKWSLLYQRLIQKADLFHTVSQFSAERLAHYFPALKDRLRVVHNAISEAYFQPLPNAGCLVRKAHIPDAPYVFVPGGLHYRKNAEAILDAWPIIHEKLPDLRLVIAGHSHPSYLARAYQLGASISVLDFVDGDLLRALYINAELVWFPSRYEGFGLPILEAMACRTPVVASNCASLPEVAGGHAILVSPDDPQEHAEIIVSLCNNPTLRRDMGQSGRCWAERFRWHNSAATLRGHFEKLL